MPLPKYLKLLVCTALLCVASVLYAKKADAGQYSHIVAIVVATDDGKTETIKVAPLNLADLNAKPIIMAAKKIQPVSTVRRTQIVCGVDGCKGVVTEVPATAADCLCDCSDCNCAPAVASTTTTTSTVTHAAGGTTFMQAGPARRVLGRVGKFIVKGGPIRQALRANRQARRGR